MEESLETPRNTTGLLQSAQKVFLVKEKEKGKKKEKRISEITALQQLHLYNPSPGWGLFRSGG